MWSLLTWGCVPSQWHTCTKRTLTQCITHASCRLMIRAGELRSPEWYQKAARALFKCITEDDHTNCKHHKPGHRTDKAIMVTCPFHKEVLRTVLQELIDKAERIIDKKFGRIQNNFLEINFLLMWRSKMKGEQISHSLWKLGDVNNNMHQSH